MTTEITRTIVLDLLPLYLAGEVSADTRALVETYLETDPDLAEIAKQSKTTDSLGEIPVPLSKEKAMETYKEAKRWMAVQTLGLAVVVAVVFLFALMAAGGFVILLLR